MDKTQSFDLTGMSCAACARRIHKAVAGLKGVKQVQVNLLKNSMQVTFDTAVLSVEYIIQAVAEIGYGASVATALWQQTSTQQSQAKDADKTLARQSNPKNTPSLQHVTAGNESKLSANPESTLLSASADSVALPKNAKLNAQDRALTRQRHNLYASITLTLPLFYLSMGKMWGWPLPTFVAGFAHTFNLALLQMLLALAVMYINRHYFSNGLKALYMRAPNMDSLIAIGSGAAAIFSLCTTYQIAATSNAQLAAYLDLIQGQVLSDIPDSQSINKLAHNLYFESAAMILTLISLGKYFEARAKGKTSQALAKLISLMPQQATVRKQGQEIQVPIEQVAVGDLVVVKAGEQVPVDGVIVEGYGLLDESALTGESIPCDKGVGAQVTGATLNTDGCFTLRTERIGADTTLAQIIQIVDTATSSSAPIARIADKISGIFVPVVIGIACLTLLVWLICGASVAFALTCSIAVLVISCPCALGLATPTAIMVGTGQAAQHGILFKSASVMERTGAIDTVILDKTGTLTTGKMQLKEVICLTTKAPSATVNTDTDKQNYQTQNTCPSLANDREQVRQQALEMLFKVAALEQLSAHPLAKAIVQASNELKEQYPCLDAPHFDISNFTNLTGQGLIGQIQGQQLAVGSSKLLQYLQFADLPQEVETRVQELSSKGHTILYVVQDLKLIGLLALSDTLKAQSAQAVALLKELAVDILLLTGDHSTTAQHIAKQAGITEVIAQVMPQDKAQVIKKLQSEGKRVAMVGDGINDAPALAQADIGIAIGAGSDIAIEAADVVLVKSELTDVVVAMQLSQAVVRNIKENLFWAFIYNAIGIPIAAGVFFSLLGLTLSPMLAAAAMSCSSVSVVSNALRLRRFKPKLQIAEHKQIVPIQQEAEVMGQVQAQDQSQAPAPNIKFEIWPVLPTTRTQTMTKKCLTIEGMSCQHCVKAVTKALSSIAGVSEVQVDLASKQATLRASADVTDDMLKQAVVDADFTVVEIK